MRMKAPKTAGRTAVYVFDVGLVEEVDWEVDVEIFEDVAVGEEEIEDEASAESVEDGEVTLTGTFEDDCGVLIGSSGLNRVSLKNRIRGRMRGVEDAVVFTTPKAMVQMLHKPRWRCRALRAGRAHFRRNPVCHNYRETWNHHNRCLHDGRLPRFSRGGESLCSSFCSIARWTYSKGLGRSGICGCEKASASMNEGHGYRQVALLVDCAILKVDRHPQRTVFNKSRKLYIPRRRR
jgi:hypothetical protein